MDMKRITLLLALCTVALPSFALNRSRTQPRTGDHIGILRASERYLRGADGSVAATVSDYLTEELQAGGFDAFQMNATYEDVRQRDENPPDYYVEIVGADAATSHRGGVDLESDSVDVNLALVFSHVAAAVNVYDGRTLELLDTYDLRRDSRAVLPTSVGVGTRHLFARIGLSVINYARYRSTAHEVARDAARRIAGLNDAK
jgi:hypothetical protein